jgi:glutamine synthetase
MATFMAKWSQQTAGPERTPARLDATRKDGAAAFYDEHASRRAISREMRWFIGGQQALMPEVLAMVASTVNSYSRLVPGFWAPTSATWGVENRTTALRVIPGRRQQPARRIPHRRGRHQSVPGTRRGHRFGAVGHRASHRA